MTGLPSGLRWVDAGNAGPFTLEGTRSHIVGRSRVAIVDPGPAGGDHVDALAAAVSDAETVVLLVTHGHEDHTAAAPALAERLGAPVLGAWEAGPPEGGDGDAPFQGPPPGLDFRRLRDGERVVTDAGELVAVATPGHARPHLAFQWPAGGAVFVGDLLLGTGDTTWVGGYRGCVSDYLASLARVERLTPQLLLPAHGGPIHDPVDRLERFRAHRLARIAQVERALGAWPDATQEQLLHIVYSGSIPPELLPAARASLDALIEHVRDGAV
jgi:glyoxylase-like metal-dependent hydrolase (beta-lactamase superfamily II)